MSEPTISIPQVIEGYADVRIVWYGQGATLRVVENDTVVQSASIDSDAFRQLAGLSTSDGGYELKTEGESDIAGMSWSKDTESPAGVISVQLFPRRDYCNMISAEDVFIVYGRGDKHSPETLIALISIDSVYENRSASSSGATVRRVQVQGRDLGKILMETPTVYDAAFGGLVMRRFYAQFVKAFSQGAARGGPSVVVQTMLAIFFSLKQNFVSRAIGQETDDGGTAETTPLKPFEFPGKTDTSLFSFLDTDSFVQKVMVGAMLQRDEPTLLQNASNLWQLCEMYANRLVNEFFIDTRDLVSGFDSAHKRLAFYAQQFINQFGTEATDQIDQIDELSDATRLSTQTSDELLIEDETPQPNKSVIALVHRQLPYDTMSFYQLPTSIVYETETFNNNLGVSSVDVKNMFRIRFPGLVEGPNQDLQFGVTINRESIKRHGLRRFEGETIYVWTNGRDSNNDVIQSYHPTYQFYQSLVTTWYAYNERLQSGTLEIRFRPDIRVGTRLTFVRSRTYYTEGVAHEINLITDFYVQGVQHTYSPRANSSRTTVTLVRGINRDGLSVQAFKESHLFWTNEGAALDPDPYEVVVSEDLFGAVKGPDSVPNADLSPVEDQ